MESAAARIHPWVQHPADGIKWSTRERRHRAPALARLLHLDTLVTGSSITCCVNPRRAGCVREDGDLGDLLKLANEIYKQSGNNCGLSFPFPGHLVRAVTAGGQILAGRAGEAAATPGRRVHIGQRSRA